jgi:hypothetical protein
MQGLDLIPESDGRVAIYENGILLGRARDQAHADDWATWWDQNQRELGAVAWDVAEILWSGMTAEQRAYFSRRAEEAD